MVIMARRFPLIALWFLLGSCVAGRVTPPGIEDGGAGKVYTIKQLRDRSLKERPADGTTVLIHGAVITAVRETGSTGFYVREGKGKTFSFITGVVNGFKDQHTLDPRDAKDLVN